MLEELQWQMKEEEDEVKARRPFCLGPQEERPAPNFVVIPNGIVHSWTYIQSS